MKRLMTVSLVLLGACSSTEHGHKEVSNASYTTDNVANRQKGDFIRMTENHLNDVERTIDRWKSEAKNASGDLKEKRYEKITDLEKKLDETRSRLNRLKTAAMSEYAKYKAQTDDAVKNLDEEFEDTEKSFR